MKCVNSLTRQHDRNISVGVDWASGKWIAAELCGGNASYRFFDNISDACREYENLPFILIDVPIGLPESAEEAEMRPDKAARKYLKVAARKSSVFPTPLRKYVYAKDKNEIHGLSCQAIGILSCIRQVDLFLQYNSVWRDCLIESHPECALQALNGGYGIVNSKHTDDGIAERALILSRYVSNTYELLAKIPKRQRNDLLDALSLAVTASMDFESVQKEVYRDSKGLPMRIVIGKP